jgi:SAM-dependent methyltransferase
MSDESRGLLTRLGAELAEAHRRYNEALTALDKAIQALPEWPAAPVPYDEQLLPSINERWRIVPADRGAQPGGWRGRLAAIVWDTVGPALRQQMDFNAALVDHLNRNARAHREAQRALESLLPVVRQGFEGLVRFESLLVQFLQQITPLVDSKERGFVEAIDELRNVAAVAQRTAALARRQIEQPGAAAPTGATSPAPGETLVEPSAYVGFEDRFRGSEAEIRARLADYVQYFEGASSVLDIGCGRGELLDLLKGRGITARGLDVNPEMVEACRARGLDATTGDALTHVASLADGSLGGIVAIQVIEHLEPAYLSRLLQTAFHKLRPGAPLVLETINPACWVAFFESYIRDLSHVRPIHAETLQYLLHASGFSHVQIVYRSPIAEDGRLQQVTARPTHFEEEPSKDPLTELVTAFNRNVERLNARLFTYQDYAAIARRL